MKKLLSLLCAAVLVLTSAACASDASASPLAGNRCPKVKEAQQASGSTNSSPQRDGALSSQAESSTVPFPSFKVTRPLSSARRRAISRGAAIFITATLTQAPAAGEPFSPRTVISNSFTGA